MFWGQSLNLYTDHKNLTRDGLGLTSNRVTCWRILLEEYSPKIIYIKGIHNTAADALSQLDNDSKVNSTNEYNRATHGMSTKETAIQRWLMFSKLWLCSKEAQEDPDKTNIIQRVVCQYTSVYCVILLPYGHSLRHFYFIHILLSLLIFFGYF